MAEKENKNSNEPLNPRSNNKRPMGNGNKMTPKFNPIYIYGILLLAFFAIQYFSTGGAPVETNWQEVRNTMLKNGDIDKIIVINKSQADIYLKESSYEKYKSKLEGNFGKPPKAGPHFYFTIGSVDVFESNLDKAQKEYGISPIPVTYEVR
jgi:cell division protease FtsH